VAFSGMLRTLCLEVEFPAFGSIIFP
jgi:hypothetical protein